MTGERLLVIVEDNAALSRVLSRSFERRGYDVLVCAATDDLATLLTTAAPQFAVVDLKIARGTGLECVKLLHAHDPSMKIVVLTGFASLTTAVEAIKLGACHYLAKPSNADDIEAAFGKGEGDAHVQVVSGPTSLKNLEWERIHETLVAVDFNVSEAARQLGLHRRTLIRKLEKRGVRS